MKLGPVHVIRDVTFRNLSRLRNFWDRFHETVAAATPAGQAVAAAVQGHATGLGHSPVGARFAPPVVLGPDDPDDPAVRQAVQRVAAAYRRALVDRVLPPAASMWDRIGREKALFLKALEQADEAELARRFSRLFQSELVWGLGQVESGHPELLQGEPGHLHLLFTDQFVSLAEAVGALRLPYLGQGAVDHLSALDVDFDTVGRAVADRIGFDLSVPQIGGGYGFRIAGRPWSLDTVVHGNTSFRLRQLGAGADSHVLEIGGGYGCLALLAYRAGLHRYTVIDLPWVNAVQGYFLIRALPPGTVRLYGEESGTVALLPFWRLASVADRSVDFAVNTDSLPEMGRATALGYLPAIRRVLRGVFLSINQEACAAVPGVGPQNWVAELVETAGGFRRLSRHRGWVRQGYVEEVFAPSGV